MIKYFFQLIRWQNLIVIAYCMYIFRYFLFVPLLKLHSIEPVLSHFHFALLTLSCVIIAAAGYIINDICDKNIDKINKPNLRIIETHISEKTAENFYIILNLIAISIGVYVAYVNNLRSLSLLFPVVAGILYFYSNTYKSILLFGNILIAILSALIPLMVILFDLPLLYIKYKAFLGIGGFSFNAIIYWFAGYIIFAFLITLFREFIKDIEDFEGDKAFGKYTMPVILGTEVSRKIAIFLLFIIIVLVIFLTLQFFLNIVSITYILSLVILPLGLIFYKLIKAKIAEDFHKISRLSKIVMLTGISFVLLIKEILIK